MTGTTDHPTGEHRWSIPIRVVLCLSRRYFFAYLDPGRHVNALRFERGRCDSLQECTYAKHICNGLHAWLCFPALLWNGLSYELLPVSECGNLTLLIEIEKFIRFFIHSNYKCHSFNDSVHDFLVSCSCRFIKYIWVLVSTNELLASSDFITPTFYVNVLYFYFSHDLFHIIF